MKVSRRSVAQSGFTLIEVVVAFAIFALAAGAVYESFSGASRRNLQAHDRDQAVLIAQSLLSQQQVAPQPWRPESSGRLAEGWLWRIEVSSYQTPLANPQSPWRAMAVTVHVTHEDSTQKQVVLRTIELARVAP